MRKKRCKRSSYEAQHDVLKKRASLLEVGWRGHSRLRPDQRARSNFFGVIMCNIYSVRFHLKYIINRTEVSCSVRLCSVISWTFYGLAGTGFPTLLTAQRALIFFMIPCWRWALPQNSVSATALGRERMSAQVPGAAGPQHPSQQNKLTQCWCENCGRHGDRHGNGEIHFCLEMALNRKAIPISTPHKHLIKKESFFGSTSLAGNSTCRYCVHISFQHDPSKMVILDYINMPSPQHSDILIRNLPNARALRHHLKW